MVDNCWFIGVKHTINLTKYSSYKDYKESL